MIKPVLGLELTAVARLNIIAHDKFQEIVDEAKRPDSQIRIAEIILRPESLLAKTETLISQPQLDSLLGFQPNTQFHPQSTSTTTQFPQPIFKTPIEQKIAQFTYAAIRNLETQTDTVPTTAYLASPTIQALVRESVTHTFKATEIQLELQGIVEQTDLAAIISKTTELVIDRTIDIPRIIIVPNGEVRSGFHLFTLNFNSINYQVPSTDLWIQTLRTQATEILGLNSQGIQENRLAHILHQYIRTSKAVDLRVPTSTSIFKLS